MLHQEHPTDKPLRERMREEVRIYRAAQRIAERQGINWFQIPREERQWHLQTVIEVVRELTCEREIVRGVACLYCGRGEGDHYHVSSGCPDDSGRRFAAGE